MSGPENPRGGDAFDDFFGDPTPSGRMGPVPHESDAAPFAEDEPTQDVELRRRTEQPTQAAAPVPAIQPEPTPQGAVPDDWWDPEPVTTPAAPVAAASTWQQSQPVGEPSPYHEQPSRRGGSGRSGSPLGLVALLVGGVLLGGLCVGGTVMAMGGGDDEPTAQTTVTKTSSPQSETSSSSPTSEETSSSSSSAPSSKSTSSSPTRPGVAPAGVKQCAGPSQGTKAGAGTTVTSCEFATAVRDAYLAADPKNGKATLRVTSPVTDKAYTMTCSGEGVTRCTGGNDAVVVLY